MVPKPISFSKCSLCRPPARVQRKDGEFAWQEKGRTRRRPFLLIFMVWAAVVANSGTILAAVPQFAENTTTMPLRGRVIEVENLEPEESVRNFVKQEQLTTVEITCGQFRGLQRPLLNSLTGHPLFDLYLTQGREVILWGEIDQAGNLQ